MALKSDDSAVQTTHVEDAITSSLSFPKLKGPPSGKLRDGDVALKLFENYDINEPVDPGEEKRLVRKVDWIILPLIAVNYAFFYIDKTTLSYAAIFGIRKDLNLSGSEYSWLSSIFYFGFLVWALPTNLLMQRLPLGKYLGVNIFLWGAFLMLQAVATDFKTLAVLRAFAGAAEACSDPAFMLITSMWYTRRQQPLRIGLWYTANGFGIALGGLFGYGIGHIRGSLPSWKYEFIIIGALCCTWGIVITIFLPDSPVMAKFLTDDEKRLAVRRLRDNQTGVENKHFKAYQVLEAFSDTKLYLFFIIGIVANIPNGGISNFGTIIIQGFGFSTLVTTLLQIPYGIIIVISILVCVYLNDRFPNNNRCKFVLLFLCPNIAGSFGLAYIRQENHIGRFVCYLLTGPYNAAFVLVLSLQIANTAGHTKKVVTNAVLFLGYCTGNIAGPFFYKGSQAPVYSLGIWSMIVSHLLEVVCILVFWMLFSRENKRRDKIQGVDSGTDSHSHHRDQEGSEGFNVVDFANANTNDASGGGQEGSASHNERPDLGGTAFEDLTDRENLNFRYIY